MNIEFSEHALDQLKIRTRISKKMITETINKPDRVTVSYKNRQLYQKTYGNEVLEVVAIKEDNKLIVITQYILEK